MVTTTLMMTMLAVGRRISGMHGLPWLGLDWGHFTCAQPRHGMVWQYNRGRQHRQHGTADEHTSDRTIQTTHSLEEQALALVAAWTL